jgi:hypothetical protein
MRRLPPRAASAAAHSLTGSAGLTEPVKGYGVETLDTGGECRCRRQPVRQVVAPIRYCS